MTGGVRDWQRPDPAWTLEDMRVDLTRRGGLAGVALHAVLDTAALPAGDAARAEAALRALPWDRPPVEPTAPDRFRYEVVTHVGDHQRRLELSEGEVPDPLRPLLDLLAEHGQIGSPSGANRPGLCAE